MPLTPIQRLWLFVIGFLVLALLCLVLGRILYFLIDRHPEWFFTEEQREELGMMVDSHIRREQAKDLLCGYPEDEVEMVPSNCDI